MKIINLKKIIFLSLIFLLIGTQNSYSNESENGDETELGLGVSVSDVFYKGLDEDPSVFPVFNITRNKFFLGTSGIGFYLNKSKNLETKIYVGYNFSGYEGDSGSYISEMERKDFFHAGFSYTYTTPIYTEFEVVTSSDIVGKSNGNKIIVGVAQLLPLIKNCFLKIGGAVIFKDENYSDYYYGVESNESTASRPEYSLGSTVNYQLKTVLAYVNKNFETDLYIISEYFDDDIKNSPIIDKSKNLIGGVICKWAF